MLASLLFSFRRKGKRRVAKGLSSALCVHTVWELMQCVAPANKLVQCMLSSALSAEGGHTAMLHKEVMQPVRPTQLLSAARASKTGCCVNNDTVKRITIQYCMMACACPLQCTLAHSISSARLPILPHQHACPFYLISFHLKQRQVPGLTIDIQQSTTH
jgi:hypothetical protein